MRREARALLLGVLVLAGLGLFVALRLEVTSDIARFLPGGSVSEELSIARALAAGEASRTMVLVVEAPEAPRAVDAARRLEERLRAEPRVGPALAFLEGGPPEGFEEALWTLYQPRTTAFFAADAEAARAALAPEALRASVARLKRTLAQPVSGLVSRVAPGDPTLVLPRLFERLAASRSEGLRVLDGRFVTDAGAAVLFLGTHASSSDARVQAPLLAGIDAAFAEVTRELGGELRLRRAGANRFAVQAEGAIRADIRRVSIGSTLGLVLLFLVLFRSLRIALLALPVVGTAFLAGTSACLAAFGAVHGLTLAFGSALIGVSIDYAVHFQCHHLLAPAPEGPRGTLARLGPGLVVSAGTTLVGFLALGFSDFPGLHELALFACVGIAAALAATHLFLPGLVGPPRPTPALRALAASLARLAGAPRRWLAVPVVLLAGLALAGLPRLRWEDGIARLNRPDPALEAEEELVRSQVLHFDRGGLVVASGADEEQALEANDRLAARLEQLRDEGRVAGFRSLAPLLPSAARQREVDAAVRGEPELWPRLEAALVAEGFRPEGFEPFRARLVAPAPPPLDWATLAASPLAPVARPFRVTLEDGVGFVTLVSGIADAEALHAELAALPRVHAIDVEGVLSSAYGAYRRQMAWLFGLGLVAVLALVLARHRALRPTLTACVPALLGAASTVGILSLAGIPMDLLALVALLMVVGMGVDYGVLLAEGRDDPAALAATRLSVVVAAVSTVLGFGLLALSDEPALFSIGATAGIGVGACLLLAPSLAALVGARPPRP